ncbi:uncharacterized protein TRIVIDRAFT_195440 [Trichoderma virens Gv29-8]|uniref:Major facilitator superfamily (MFS) profile domain-containing protein n=1 Tax=Hypocrea virens (strain Gv29-8 / FGSC 10586) TaxID=413071 RepID=G9N993_HYPVG|nr:uncharacterized protein TRIVIDRAFT_195440 [Trichoderma virens Gv29-8]EHK16514.1 hypothetical protein TRIVIDRAFT_195440 [Trichoderma virens Gv29-8]UKZ52108.1 hypothetical protein TrVGV298_005881 [Trichoderma virens]
MTQPGDMKENAVDEKASNPELDTVNANYTEAEYKRVLWKVDLVLLPFMWLCSGTQAADKSSISAQATFGLLRDTNLVGQQFSWLTTAFFLSYLIGEAPSNYLMQRFGVNKVLFIYMFLWGVIVLCLAFAQNFAHLVALRSLQGFLEGIMGPALLIITGSFYVSREHTLRSIIWSTSSSGMDIITQLGIYAIGNAAQKQNHNSSFGAWRWISVFLGLWTIILSFFSLLILGTLSEVRWLSKDERRIAAARVASNQTGSDRGQRRPWRWDQVLEAMEDPQTYFFFFGLLISGIPSSGTAAFGNLVYVSFGFTNLETIVKGTVPLDLVSAVWFLFVGFSTLKWPQTRLPSNIAGRTKRSVIGIVMFVGYCVGSAIGAQTFRAEWAPRYIPAIIICGIMYGVMCALFIAWRLYYMAENKRRAKKIAEMRMTPEQSAHQGTINGEADMTDRQNIHFKYSV